MEENVEKAVQALIEKMQEDVAIKEYNQAKKKIARVEEIARLEKKIKATNQEIVHLKEAKLFGHHEQAEKISKKETEQFDQLPLVKEYRTALFEADELLQFVVREITQQINEIENK